MAGQKSKYYPKTKAEFDAYVRAMDDANAMAIKSGTKKNKTASKTTRQPTRKN